MTDTGKRESRPGLDRDSEPFWSALHAGELRLQRCTRCEILRWPPRAMCNRCFHFDAVWQRVSGRGVLVSWIRTHQVFAPVYSAKVPYIVIQVALAEQDDVMMIGGWQSDRDPVTGEVVEARFTVADGDEHLLDWAPVDGAG